MVWYDPDDLPEGLNIVTREQWGARDPDPEAEAGPLVPMETPVVRVCLNCTASKVCYTREDCIKLVQFIQDNEIDCGLPDLTYNFMLGADGNVYEGRGWYTQSEMVYGKNKHRTLNLAFLGWFMDVDPLPKQIVLARKFIDYGIQCKKIKPDYKEYWFRD